MAARKLEAARQEAAMIERNNRQQINLLEGREFEYNKNIMAQRKEDERVRGRGRSCHLPVHGIVKSRRVAVAVAV